MAVTERNSSSEPNWTLGGEPWMAAWPAIESELRKVVCRRIPADCDVRDVLQEVCVRMLESGRALDEPGEAVRYATTVACNYVRDLHRRRSRSLPTGVFDVVSEDVERAVMARLRFEALTQGVAELDPKDRHAFADPCGDPALKTGAMRVRRSRVRGRLAASIKGAVGGGWGLPRLRWLLLPASAAAVLVPAFPVLPGGGGAVPAMPAASGRSAEAEPDDHGPAGSPDAPATATANLTPTGSNRRTGEPPDRRGQYKADHVIDGPIGTGAQTGTWTPPHGEDVQPLICLSGVSPDGDLCTPEEAHPRTLGTQP